MHVRVTLAIIALALLEGCAVVYTGVSTATLAATGKSIPEQAASQITNSDCSTWNYLVKDRDYLCERRDIAETYNRTSF